MWKIFTALILLASVGCSAEGMTEKSEEPTATMVSPNAAVPTPTPGWTSAHMSPVVVPTEAVEVAAEDLLTIQECMELSVEHSLRRYPPVEGSDAWYKLQRYCREEVEVYQFIPANIRLHFLRMSIDARFDRIDEYFRCLQGGRSSCYY